MDREELHDLDGDTNPRIRIEDARVDEIEEIVEQDDGSLAKVIVDASLFARGTGSIAIPDEPNVDVLEISYELAMMRFR